MAQQTDWVPFVGLETTAAKNGELWLVQAGKPDRNGDVFSYQVLLDFINELREQAGMKPYYPNAPALGGKPQDNSPSLGTNQGRGQKETPDH